MKKNFMLSVLLLVCGAMTAQEQSPEFEITRSPEFIESACSNGIFIKGVSANGRYCWGNNRYDGYYCDLETGEYALISATKEQKKQGYVQSTIAGITDDGVAVINLGLRETYLYNIETGDKTYLKSPMEDYPFINVWDMTSDGSVLGGNFITAGNFQYPMCAVRQDDGSYKMMPLEHDVLDAVGDTAQFTQLRCVMNSGKYLAGSQIDYSGSVARYVVWKLNEDGTYKYTTPFDEYLYDFDAENPGPRPNINDYVTSKDPSSAEYKQQLKDFYAIDNAWYSKFEVFTKNYSTVDWGGIRRSSREDWLCGSFKLAADNYWGDLEYSPLYYNCETEKVINLDEMDVQCRAAELLGEGKYLIMEGNRFMKLMIYENGVKRPFYEWLQEKTGVDVSENYHFVFDDYQTGMEVDDIIMGFPVISNDGKTLMLTTFVEGDNRASVIKFSNSIYGDVETGIEAKVVNNFEMSGTVIEGNADVDVYTLDGKLVKTLHVSGNVDMKDVLGTGTYVVKVKADKNVTKSFKMIIL